LNAYYTVESPQYDGSYKKNYWQGVALNGGIGGDIDLTQKVSLTSSITYSFVNPVHSDKFLFSQDENEIPLPHTYLRLSIGVKLLL